ncbi:MAG: Dabb family protein [Campylobacterales bacterium]|nr:Dabb family protein [Campylobacterales bacterium]
MIVHIVMFKFKDENKQENLLVAKSKLEELLSKVPTLNSMEVGINFANEARAFDLSLYSTFNSKDDLKAYAIHPEHLQVVEFIKKVAQESKVVDYEL